MSCRARSSRSSSTSDLPVSRPMARKNVHAMAPPSRMASTLGRSASMRSILPLILAPPSTATNGRFGLVQRLAEVAELLLHQKARHGRLEEPRHRLGARVRPVGGAERVVHVEIAERGEALGEGVVVGFFARVEPRVLADGDAAARQPPGGRHRLLRRRIGEERHRRAEQPLELAHDRLHRVLGIGPALGPAEVGQQHHAGATLAQVLDGGQRRPDPRVVGDRAVLHRTVEIHPDERAPAIDARRVERFERALHSRWPT